ncbi:aminodeoxychorismate synthase component I [Micromonospora sp. DR5-3]|uniref:aminodeoxychorismate synthase component I n=1 Tax=unclassified Micromonospora TaxID=2617518 RepID=UPI0011D3AAD6|nr:MULTISPECIES: aminodeoxychorismate synthase component I [unclassified Micromonospora]MCW3815838.1 aminodeoxychorismate synthase component I [Micromonospora sp. DR5-3]TYC19445.1 aminodeoxychorismate synthase component I [Micromonospora sp. MP36]
MRTLIIDNYDSFTYNLFHYVAEVTGTEPTVITNDDPRWQPEWLDEFDNVLLSPGPGRPERHRDFGLCREVFEAGRLPVLGVCLGHQGLCHLLGGRVAAAPEPRHGRLSRVHHDGSELFAGIPSPFEVVRYHSLAVDQLPPSLVASARSEDGVLMAVRHRHRPVWGVQFHPESIRTEHGRRLLANFDEATWRWRAERPRHAAPARRPHRAATPQAVSAAPTGPAAPRHRVLVRRLRLAVETEALFDAQFRGSPYAFWLDNNQRGGAYGAGISVLGDASGPLARVVRADVAAGTVTETSADGERTYPGPFLDWLDADLRKHRAEPEVPLPFDFALGWVGYLGYELKAECGARLAHRAPTPDAMLVFADRAVVVDHRDDSVWLLALARGDDTAAARRWQDETAARMRALAGRTLPPAAPRLPERVRHPVELRHQREEYLDLIAACQRAIVAGESYEVCLTNMLTVRGRLSPWPVYRALRRATPAPFAAFLEFGDVAVLSSSPERFLRISAAGVAESKPIKGTRPRGSSRAEDAALRADLLHNEKDQAENLMIVDLVRNDLGRVAEVGTVTVPELFVVESYATVHQLVSTVRARLRPDRSAVDCVRAAFPGGSMTGAPKLRTMEIIDELEDGPRGIYSGALGYFSLTGAADLSMVIRTLVVAGEQAYYGVGGAIIALSEPAAEFEETAVKASGLMTVLGLEFPQRVPEPAGSAAGRPGRGAA